MERCPHCHQPVGVPAASACAACGKSLRASAEASISGEVGVSSSVPAEEKKAAAKRLVSTAGPSVPVRTQPTNDSVPAGAGWMERLEAARHAGFLSTLPEVEADDVEAVSAPGKGANGHKNGNNGAFVAKPAHLLIAELEEEDEARRRERKKSGPTGGPGPISIEEVEFEKPQAKEQKKRMPTWIPALIIGIIVVAVGAIGVKIATEEPPPEPTRALDPTLVAKVERRKQAVVALEEGHKFVMMGKSKADDAIKAYNKALALEPTLAKAERGLAAAYASKNDVERAVTHYRRYLVLDPKAEDAEEVRKIIEKHEDDPMRPKRKK